MMRVCGYPNLELPVTVYDLDGGTGGGLSCANEITNQEIKLGKTL